MIVFITFNGTVFIFRIVNGTVHCHVSIIFTIPNSRFQDGVMNKLIYTYIHTTIGASLSEPTLAELGTVVHVQRTVAKNGIATHCYSVVGWFMCKQTR